MALKSKEFLKKFLGRVPFVRRFAEDEKGATLVYVALSLPVILGFAGIGVDIAVWNLDKRQSQSMADAAAMEAGVSVLRTGGLAVINNWARDGAVRNGFDDTGIVTIANGFSNAAGETIIINNPPSVGVFSAAVFGDPDGDGIFGDTDAIEIFVRRPAPMLFSSMVLNTSDQFVRSRAVIRAINDPGENCMISLDPDGGITLNGGGSVNLDCGALSNGDLDINGGGCLNATQVLVVGSADPNCVPAVPSITRPDPLRFMPEVNDRACNRNAPLNVTNGNTVDVYPDIDGIYVFCGDISILPGGTLNLHSGVYVFHGSNFGVNGKLNTVGGAMIYFSELASNANSINIAGGAIVNFDPLAPGMLDGNVCDVGGNISPPGPGPTLTACGGPADIDPTDPDPAFGSDLDEIYEGIAFFSDRDAADGVAYSFQGGPTMSINGVIYMPGGDVTFAGGADADVKAILADSVTVSGNADFGTIDGTILSSLLAYTFIKLVE